MLKYRLPSGILLGAVVLSSVFIEGPTGLYIFLLLGIFLAFTGVCEYLKMVEKTGFPSFPVITASVSSFILACTVLGLAQIIYTVLTIALLAGWLYLLLSENRESALKRNIASFSALPLLVFPLSLLALIYTMEGHVSGRMYFFFMLSVTKFGDIGAYTIGTLSSKLMPGGNHKILPKISPKKSWEGTLGGMAASVILSYVFCYYIPAMAGHYGRLFPLTAGIILFWGGFAGDLVESALKRTAGVKDSGNIIPGMGGALDVIDSLILNAPVFYLFLTLAG
jgi:phosphatidate cytidylyltransferase